jgi:hypothetical protein
MSHISLVAASAGFSPEVIVGKIDEEGVRRAVSAPSSRRVVGVVGI